MSPLLDLPVELTDEALLQLCEIPGQADYRIVRHALRSLEQVNEAYGEYDPGYEAARPPVPCRVCYAGHFGIYYAIAGERVVVFSIIDNRLDPAGRFAEIDDPAQLEAYLLGLGDQAG